ncbi:muconolactone Delta-isomerase family protein [Georgenia ruanii]|uniref:Muconolactone delta-isomerase n=1 Tax=Georgenia ruanii TaxID=348442 RepID=A0A7J9V106_9MICO|nr:muconolactone Delta-isomerase family protein [Georgenia ruanii]MPV90559.1 muconolactone delta-isomerase [Georgenia ruanii]
MEFLITMTTQVPDGTAEDAIAEMRSREATRAAQLIGQGNLLRLWRPPLQPGEWRTYALFTAADVDELEELLTSMPLRAWRTDEVTPLSEHPNDPARRGTTPVAAPGSEYFTWFTLVIPADTAPETVAAVTAAEARCTAELASKGRLLRLWVLPGDGRALGLWAASDIDAMRADLETLPMVGWLGVDITPLSVHPSDPHA